MVKNYMQFQKVMVYQSVLNLVYEMGTAFLHEVQLCLCKFQVNHVVYVSFRSIKLESCHN